MGSWGRCSAGRWRRRSGGGLRKEGEEEAKGAEEPQRASTLCPCTDGFPLCPFAVVVPKGRPLDKNLKKGLFRHLPLGWGGEGEALLIQKKLKSKHFYIVLCLLVIPPIIQRTARCQQSFPKKSGSEPCCDAPLVSKAVRGCWSSFDSLRRTIRSLTLRMKALKKGGTFGSEKE